MDVPLVVEVLETVFTVYWGERVTAVQRDSMDRAWSRCIVETPEAPAVGEPVLPTASLPFTALLAYQSKLPDGGRQQLTASTFEQLAEYLTSQLTLAAIWERAGELTMLHACGLADLHTGAVLALVAKSGTGKTTAAKVLARNRGYVTDETVAIRQDGSIVPYPKPLSLKQATVGAAKIQVGPEELGLAKAPRELRLGGIVLLNRISGSAAPSLEPVPLADAVLALIPDSSSQAKMQRPLQSLCELIEGVGGVWRVDYSEATDLAKTLEPLFSPLPKIRCGWSAPSWGTEAGSGMPGRYIRVQPGDAVEIDGDVMLLLDTEVVRLSGIAPTIWKAADRPVSVLEVVQALELQLGLPDGYEALVEEALATLVARGVLAVTA